MIVNNSLIEWTDSAENGFKPFVERVLYVDTEQDTVVLIDRNRNNDKALPYLDTLTGLEEAIQSGQAIILPNDPCARFEVVLNKEQLPEAKRKKVEKHEDETRRRWSIVQYLLSTYGSGLFIPSIRGSACHDAAEQFGITDKTALKLLRWYWQDGQNIQALRSHYGKKVGAKPRKITQKLGRPTNYTKLTNSPKGKNLTEDDKNNIRRAIRIIIIGPGENKPKKFIKNAHIYLLENFYSDGYKLHNGNIEPNLKSIDQRPSRNQVRDLYYKEFSYLERVAHRDGRSAPYLKAGSSLRDSTLDVFSAGSQFQIDATIGDIYLVSIVDPTRIIGRPVIYLVIDTYSRLIVGYSVSLEGPSWIGATLALLNVIEDKVNHCKQLGIDIPASLWPIQHISNNIVADRGEFEGYNANLLLENWGLDDLIVLPPYRPDMKTFVEGVFPILNQKLIQWIPGAVYKVRDRGVKDYRLDATLNLNQFRHLVVKFILRHNNTRRITSHPDFSEMVKQGLEPYPINIWNWGLRRAGRLKEIDFETAHLGILPRETASVTRQGIDFGGLLYTCDTAEAQHWFEQSRQRRWSVTLAHDPRSTDEVYLCFEDGRTPERCRLTPRHQRYAGMTRWEALDRRALDAQANILAEDKDLLNAVNEHASTMYDINQFPMPNTDGMSKTQRVADIRSNRHTERELDGQQAISKLPSRSGLPSSDVTPTIENSEPIKPSGKPPDDLGMLQQSRKKGSQNGKE